MCLADDERSAMGRRGNRAFRSPELAPQVSAACPIHHVEFVELPRMTGISA